MTFLSISSSIIPGYESLPEKSRTTFETSTPGKKFTQLVHSILLAAEELEVHSYWWHRVTGETEKRKQKLKNQFEQQKEQLITNIHGTNEYKIIRREIEKNKELIRQEKIAQHRALLDEHTKELSQFFPLLNYRKFTKDESIIKQISAKYSYGNGALIEDPERVDEEELTDLFFHCMRQVSQVEIDFMSLDLFNKKQAKKMATAVLNAFHEKSTLNFDEWFQEYQNDLRQYITDQLKLINNKKWQIKHSELAGDILSSLSYLWKNPAVDQANAFVGRLADAHGFIQATGFSTQNENSFLAILDLYNYARYHDQISETRSILMGLLTPFYPLLEEYKYIGLYEKNNYWKLFRTVMPIVVAVSFIVAVAAILVPLALPELAFFAVFIPSLLIGLGLANQYVATKNAIYNGLRELYYGGPFEIPEFQINIRMLKAFGTKENALLVRAFYIEELKHCNKLEIDFSLKHELGILSPEDIDQRKINREKRQQLCLEWYDIHSNKDLSYKQGPVIALNRMQETSDKEYQQLQKLLENELDSIDQSVTQVTADIKATIINHNKMPVSENDAEREAPTISANYRYGLFRQPQCLKHKVHLEDIDRLSSQINRQLVAHS